MRNTESICSDSWESLDGFLRTKLQEYEVEEARLKEELKKGIQEIPSLDDIIKERDQILLDYWNQTHENSKKTASMHENLVEKIEDLSGFDIQNLEINQKLNDMSHGEITLDTALSKSLRDSVLAPFDLWNNELRENSKNFNDSFAALQKEISVLKANMSQEEQEGYAEFEKKLSENQKKQDEHRDFFLKLRKLNLELKALDILKSNIHLLQEDLEKSLQNKNKANLLKEKGGMYSVGATVKKVISEFQVKNVQKNAKKLD